MMSKNECEGCADRDRLIKILSKRIDELDPQVEVKYIPTIEEMVGLVPNITDGLSLKEYMELSNAEFLFPPDNGK